MRGDGTLYKRGPVYWYSYYVHGKQERESLRTTDEDTAKKRARRIRDGLLQGTIFAASERRVTVDELLNDLVSHLTVKRAAWLPKASYYIARLRQHFGAKRAEQLDTAAVQRFQAECQEIGLADATVNRHCEILRQAYRLAFTRTPPKITRLPYIPLLKVTNARQGFLGADDFAKILRAVEDADLRDYLEWFWWTGMRPKEIAQLEWTMFDRETWTLNLSPKAAKTRHPRLIPLVGPTKAVMERRIAARRLDTKLIFHRRGGQPVKHYMDAWAAACKSAGLRSGRKTEGGVTPYDLRRSALRNIVRGGTDFTVAMKISGHKTRSTFDRYNITSDEDVRAALERTAEYVAKLPGGGWAKTPTRPAASHRRKRRS